MRSVAKRRKHARGKHALGAKRGKHHDALDLYQARKTSPRCQAREHEPGAYQARRNAERISQVTIGFKFVTPVIG